LYNEIERSSRNVTFGMPYGTPFFAPLDQFRKLRQCLKVRTSIKCDLGFAGTTLQPNSGAQGEYAGLMTIRAYHLSRGDDQEKYV
jgi:glycine dehydrogenase